MIYAPGATSISTDIMWLDDAGAAVTGKVAADFGAVKWSSGTNTADTTITISDLAAITTAHPNDNTAGGVKEREAGLYRLDLPNNMFTSAGRKALSFVETTNRRIIVLGGNSFDVQSLATPTNITGGTITTVTNLTNAPTSGDLTAAMKSSVTAAVPTAVQNRTEMDSNSVGLAAIYSRLGAPVGASISADVAGVPAAFLDLTNGVETGLTPRNAFRLIVAATAGKISGGGTSTIVIRNSVADTKDRITATVDADGNRTAITTDLT